MRQFIVFWCVSVVLVANQALGLAVPEVPEVNVTLSGGPDAGKVKPGTNFVLTCAFTVKYPKNYANRWKSVTTFWLDDEPLGEYRKMKTTYLDLDQRAMHWVTDAKLPKGVNVFPINTPVDSFDSNYSIVVQPLSKKAKDDYECSVTLENENFTKVRYFSNKLDYS